MSSSELHVVTGAFGFTGRAITKRLLAEGKRVATLTNHPGPADEFGGLVSVSPFNFHKPDELTESLRGASVLYNTYWVRFSHGHTTFEAAIENSKTLIRAARDAGVRKLVHVSITNPSEDSPLPYFHGKALVEQAIKESGIEYAILRPAVLFGDQGILINNIAWLLRHIPLFSIPGSGKYRLQPIFVEDLADLAVILGAAQGNSMTDAVGPETFTFNELVHLIARAVGSHAMVVHLPPGLVLAVSKALGPILGDVILTKDEIDGLVGNLLVTSSPPSGRTPLSDWLERNSAWLGKKYMSELRKHFR